MRLMVCRELRRVFAQQFELFLAARLEWARSGAIGNLARRLPVAVDDPTATQPGLGDPVMVIDLFEARRIIADR
jgi:hypothetical protein